MLPHAVDVATQHDVRFIHHGRWPKFPAGRMRLAPARRPEIRGCALSDTWRYSSGLDGRREVAVCLAG